MDPSKAATMTWPNFVFFNPLNTMPLDSMLSDSIIIIITTTSPVIRTAFLNMSMNRCMALLQITGNEKIHNRPQRRVCRQSDDRK